jgi:hypothetical protein
MFGADVFDDESAVVLFVTAVHLPVPLMGTILSQKRKKSTY